MSWSTLDWTGLDWGLDCTIVLVVFIALGYWNHIERHPRGWRDMAMHPQLPDPFGNKTGGLVWDWAWPGNLVPFVSRILVTGMSTQAQETWAFTKCPRLARYYASLGHSHRRVCRPLHCTYFCIVLYNSSISLSLVRVRKHHSLRDRVSDQ